MTINWGTSGGFDFLGVLNDFYVRALVLQSSDQLFRWSGSGNISIIWHFTVIQAKLLIYSMIVGHGVCKWWSSGVKIQVNISEEIITFNKLSLHYCSGIIWRLLSHPWSIVFSLFLPRSEKTLRSFSSFRLFWGGGLLTNRFTECSMFFLSGSQFDQSSTVWGRMTRCFFGK